MPRVSHFGGARKKGRNKPSTQARPPLPPPSAPPIAQASPLSTDAPPFTQTSLVFVDATISVETPSQALQANQTWPQRRQRTKAPSQAPPSSTNALSSTQAPPPSTSAPSSFQASAPLIDAPPSTQALAPSTEAPSQAPLATRTRLQCRQRTKAPSLVPPPPTNALLSPHAPPPPSTISSLSMHASPPSTNASLSTHAPPPLSQAPSSPFDTPPSTQAPLEYVDVTPSPEAPSQAPPATQTQPRGRQSTRYWTIDVKDASGVTKVAHLRLKDLWELPNGTKVVLPLNDCKQPVGEAGGLLGQALGQLGANFAALPICYKSWSKVPNNYKEEIYNSKIKEKFVIVDDLVKKIIIKRIGEKWKENRSDVFHKYYDSKLSREENYDNHPPEINRDHWIQFIEYRLDPNTMKMCKRNAESREKLLVVHRGGSKTLARKRYEMEVENGEPVSRGKVFVAIHAKDGSCANDAAQAICDKINQIESDGGCSQAIAPNDSLGQALGEDRAGRVRGLGLGPCKTQVFGTETEMQCEGSASFAQMQEEIVDLRARLERETKSRLEFQNAAALVLQHVATPSMTPEIAAILTPMLTRAFQATRGSDGNVGPRNGSSPNS